MDYAKMLALLLAAHALCDYPLQGDFLAKAKNPAQPIPGVPWWCAMAAHCAIHAGAVLLVTAMGPARYTSVKSPLELLALGRGQISRRGTGCIVVVEACPG